MERDLTSVKELVARVKMKGKVLEKAETLFHDSRGKTWLKGKQASCHCQALQYIMASSLSREFWNSTPPLS